MSRRPGSLSRRLGDGAGIPFMGSLNPKSRASPFLSIGLVLVGAFLIIGYVYSGSGGSNGDKAALSRLEGKTLKDTSLTTSVSHCQKIKINSPLTYPLFMKNRILCKKRESL
ncbi:hypothetical protein Hanom_Chr03g00225351 [Helianthus anomalus]